VTRREEDDNRCGSPPAKRYGLIGPGGLIGKRLGRVGEKEKGQGKAERPKKVN
jgi:hypothetical protein